MKLIDDATVRRLLDPAAAREAVDRALRHFADGQAAVQARVRTIAGPVKLSTMAAVDLGGRVAGAKVYTTIAGRFRFVVLLFDAESGAPLAVLESDAMTEVRTAAVTAVAARALAGPMPTPSRSSAPAYRRAPTSAPWPAPCPSGRCGSSAAATRGISAAAWPRRRAFRSNRRERGRRSTGPGWS